MALTVNVDSKGRLLVPQELRKALGITPGDTLIAEADEEQHVLRFAKTEDPFDVLARHALAEYRAGRTQNLRQFAAQNGIALEED